MQYCVISPRSLHHLIRAGRPVDLIDVRTPAEFSSVQVEAARNHPLDSLNPNEMMKHRLADQAEPVYLMCKSGTRARMAYEKFLACGHDNVVLVDGSMQAWESAALPVVRGEKRMSLDCQMRVTVGSMVLFGVALSLLVSPYFLVISAIAGAGLFVAGIRDSCPMVSFLTLMPWNRNAGSTCAGASGEPGKKRSA